MARSRFRGRSGTTRTTIVPPIGRLVGHVPDASERAHGAGARAVLLTVRVLWWYRREALVVVACAAVWQIILTVVPRWAAWPTLVAAVAVLATVERRTEALRTWLRVGVVRRAFDRACRHTWAYELNNRTPRVRRVVQSAVGYRLVVDVPPGLQRERLQRHADDIAAALRVRALRVVPDPARADRALVTAVVRDPLETAPSRSPLLAVTLASVQQPVPFGMDEDGEPVELDLVRRSLLVAASVGPDASTTLAHLVTAAALDPTVALWLLDLGGMVLHPWRGRADARATTIGDAVSLLHELSGIIDVRMQSGDALSAGPGGHAVHVVACDLAAHRALPDGDAQRLGALIDDVVTRGPMVRVVPLLAVDAATTIVLPATIQRFTSRWALRCATAEVSDAILGGEWAACGINAADIDRATPDVGWLVDGAGLPSRLRRYGLTRPDVAALAARAVALRNDIGRAVGDEAC